MRYLVEDLEDGVLRDGRLLAAAPTAIAALREDGLIARQAPPLSAGCAERLAGSGARRSGAHERE